MHCICLRGVSQRAWGSTPHLPAGERIRDLGSRDGGRDVCVCVRTWGWDLQRQPLEVPRKLTLPTQKQTVPQPAVPNPNKPKMCIFRGSHLAIGALGGTVGEGGQSGKQAGSSPRDASWAVLKPLLQWTQPGRSPDTEGEAGWSLCCWPLWEV